MYIRHTNTHADYEYVTWQARAIYIQHKQKRHSDHVPVTHLKSRHVLTVNIQSASNTHIHARTLQQHNIAACSDAHNHALTFI